MAERSIAPTLYLGGRQLCYHHVMKVQKEKFDKLLSTMIKAKPEPRKKILNDLRPDGLRVFDIKKLRDIIGHEKQRGLQLGAPQQG